MEKQPVKLTNDELDKIKNIGNSYRETVIKFGELQLERIEIQSVIENISKREDELIKLIQDLKNQEKTTINSILEKYGEGNLSLKDGTFTPI